MLVLEEYGLSDPTVRKLLHDHLVREGSILIKLARESSESLNAFTRASTEAFALPDARKHGFHDPETKVGWRNVGIEYSAVPERPDLMESLSFTPAYEERLKQPTLGETERSWLDCARATGVRLDRLLTGIFDALARHYGGATREPGEESLFANGSFLQVNLYTRSTMVRPVLQDAHEDGNLLTILAADAPGLEFSRDGTNFAPATIAPGHVIVFPGSVMTAMTSGELRPLIHRVVRADGVTRRQSVMYFGNPSPGVRLRPWRGTEEPSLDAWQSPSRFGLPNIPST